MLDDWISDVGLLNSKKSFPHLSLSLGVWDSSGMHSAQIKMSHLSSIGVFGAGIFFISLMIQRTGGRITVEDIEAIIESENQTISEVLLKKIEDQPNQIPLEEVLVHKITIDSNRSSNASAPPSLDLNESLPDFAVFGTGKRYDSVEIKERKGNNKTKKIPGGPIKGRMALGAVTKNSEENGGQKAPKGKGIKGGRGIAFGRVAGQSTSSSEPDTATSISASVNDSANISGDAVVGRGIGRGTGLDDFQEGDDEEQKQKKAGKEECEEDKNTKTCWTQKEFNLKMDEVRKEIRRWWKPCPPALSCRGWATCLYLWPTGLVNESLAIDKQGIKRYFDILHDGLNLNHIDDVLDFMSKCFDIYGLRMPFEGEKESRRRRGAPPSPVIATGLTSCRARILDLQECLGYGVWKAICRTKRVRAKSSEGTADQETPIPASSTDAEPQS